MARACPRKVREYSLKFKVTAVQVSQQPGIQVQPVVAALDIHPFMLSRWRKQVRYGVLRGKGRVLRVRRCGRLSDCRMSRNCMI